MRINNYLCFREERWPGVIEYLDKEGVSYKHSYGFISFDIHEDDPAWEKLSFYVNKYDISYQSETHFSKEDIDNAEWMIVWCRWRCGYPQPEGHFFSKNYTYDLTHRCENCGFGEHQIASFRMKKTPKWGRRNFAELFWISEELFLSENAKQVLENQSISGISFESVLSKSGTEKLEDVYQLVVSNILPAGLIEEESALRRTETCPICGQKRHLNNGRGMDTYRKDIFNDAPDIVKTGDIFGSDKQSIRRIIINQKVCKILTQNKLDSGLVFKPIKLI